MKHKFILLIEDSEDDIELTIRALKQSKIVNDIIVVKDGSEALDFFACTGKYSDRDPKEMPVFVLLDLNLPRVNGLDILKNVRANPDTKLLPVIILTASREESDMLQGYETGANSYIIKPVDKDNFNESVRKLGLYWLLWNEPPYGNQ